MKKREEIFMLKINLGGTCGNSKWRNELIEKLDKKLNIEIQL